MMNIIWTDTFIICMFHWCMHMYEQLSVEMLWTSCVSFVRAGPLVFKPGPLVFKPGPCPSQVSICLSLLSLIKHLT